MTRFPWRPSISDRRRSNDEGDRVRIRRMRLRDIDAVLAIEEASFPLPWSRASFLQELTANPFAHYVVAARSGRVIGYGGLWLVVDEAHLTNVAVHPAERGRGTGGRILEALLRFADRRGCRVVTLEVRRSNEVARRLYEKHGFEVRNIRRGYYSDNHEDALLMVRSPTSS